MVISRYVPIIGEVHGGRHIPTVSIFGVSRFHGKRSDHQLDLDVQTRSSSRSKGKPVEAEQKIYKTTHDINTNFRHYKSFKVKIMPNNKLTKSEFFYLLHAEFQNINCLEFNTRETLTFHKQTKSAIISITYKP